MYHTVLVASIFLPMNVRQLQHIIIQIVDGHIRKYHQISKDPTVKRSTDEAAIKQGNFWVMYTRV